MQHVGGRVVETEESEGDGGNNNVGGEGNNKVSSNKQKKKNVGFINTIQYRTLPK